MIKINDKVPDFSGIDQNGNKIQLSDYKEHKLVIFFYPKASTPGCTAQVCNLRDGFDLLKEKGYSLLGVSADSVKKQHNFSKKNNLPFPIIADEERKIIDIFGVWGEKNFMGKTHNGIFRTTFVLDENHIVKHVIEKVKTKDHTEQLLEII